MDHDAVAQNGRPNKRVYRLTERGRAELRSWVADLTPATRLKDDSFTVTGPNGCASRRC